MSASSFDTDLASCVQCGLCLPHCPTYRVTGEESASPRGRIALMRQVQWDDRPVDDEFRGFMDACVLCRGCESACPSAVPFGRLMETTRARLVDAGQPAARRFERLALRSLPYHRLVLAGSTALAAAQRVGLAPRRLASRLGLPSQLPSRREPLRATGADVWLFTGCVMDAWQRPVHAAVIDVLGRIGVGVALPRPLRGAGCCGALHVHAGLQRDAQRMGERVIATMPGDAPVLVDSAGCGAVLKDYGRLVGTEAAMRFAARVCDVHEFLAGRSSSLPPRRRAAAGGAVVAVQDPCHLRHVQQSHAAVRTVLAPYVETMVELDDEGLCCGAGGAYATSHAELAGAIRSRKLDTIARSGATVVASANPGCALHLQAAGVDVRHPIELVAEAVR